MIRMILPVLFLVLGLPETSTAQLAVERIKTNLEDAWLRSGHELADIQELELQSMHTSSLSGITHAYFQQSFRGIPILNGLGSIHLDAEGQVRHVNFRFYEQLTEKIKTTNPRIPADQISNEWISTNRNNPNRAANAPKHKNTDPIADPVLQYVENEDGALILAYRLSYDHLPGSEDRPVIWIDANDGREIRRHNRTLYCHFEPETSLSLPLPPAPPGRESPTDSYPATPVITGTPAYFAFPLWVESPAFGERQLLGAEAVDATASPLGWHRTATGGPMLPYTRGNNVYAYYAPLGEEDPAPQAITRAPLTGNYLLGNVPWSEDWNFDYRNSLNQLTATNFLEDAVTNLFVRNNFVHDLLFRYGFDEAAGNFQTTNLSDQGLGNDHVLAAAQDGLGVNQASFFTPPDGQSPRMRMFLWNTDLPDSRRDGSFDNLIIAHEYAHGLSFRLIGGANNTSCLTNFEQGGEGWSDYLGLMLTLSDRNGDGLVDEHTLGEGVRGIGHYLLNEAETEAGLRPRHYTTNMDCRNGICNEFTYADLELLSPPHGVGFLWCTMLWDLTWNLINTYGFESKLLQTDSDAGNIRALKIVIEALKMTPCQPSFIDMRDAILAANELLFQGEGNDLLWAAFARRGLGYSAAPNGMAAFDDPYMRLIKTVDKTEAQPGETITFTLSLTNHTDQPLRQTMVSDQLPEQFTVTAISDGGTQSTDGLVSWPQVTIPKGRTIVRTITGHFAATISPTTVTAEYPVEPANLTGFVPAGGWITSSDYPNPNGTSTTSWFHLNPPTATESSLVLSLNLAPDRNHHLSFWHAFDLEPALDAGVVEVLVDGAWQDLGPNMIKNGYNSLVLDELPTPVGLPIPFTTLSRRRAFSGSSSGYQQTIIDLSRFEGLTQIRFRFASNLNTDVNACDDATPGCDGWFIDDVSLLDLQHLPNTACATSAKSVFSACGDIGPLGTVLYPGAEGMLAPLPKSSRAAPQIRIFPNPARDRMSLQLPIADQPGPVRILLFNSQGKLVDQFAAPPGEQVLQIDGSALPRGLYLLSIRSENRTLDSTHRITFQ